MFLVIKRMVVNEYCFGAITLDVRLGENWGFEWDEAVSNLYCCMICGRETFNSAPKDPFNPLF